MPIALNDITIESFRKIFKQLLKAQIETSKYYLDEQCSGLDKNIYEAMDF